MRRSRHPVTALLGILLLVPGFSACGLVFGGTRQVVRTTSSPNGASVVTNPQTAEYMTPTSLSLERGKNYTLTFSAPGYTSRTLELQRSIRGGIVVLDIVLGIVPVVVDAATGAWYKLSPDTVNVSLEKADARIDGPARIDVRIDVERGRERPRMRVDCSAPGVLVDVRSR